MFRQLTDVERRVVGQEMIGVTHALYDALELFGPKAQNALTTAIELSVRVALDAVNRPEEDQDFASIRDSEEDDINVSELFAELVKGDEEGWVQRSLRRHDLADCENCGAREVCDILAYVQENCPEEIEAAKVRRAEAEAKQAEEDPRAQLARLLGVNLDDLVEADPDGSFPGEVPDDNDFGWDDEDEGEEEEKEELPL
jgi:hypothetical protein